jgi:hypothetical protein
VPKRYTRLQSAEEEARKQLDSGTDVAAMMDAAGALRDYDAEHPVVTALEARIRRAFEANLLSIRTTLARASAEP